MGLFYLITTSTKGTKMNQIEKNKNILGKVFGIIKQYELDNTSLDEAVKGMTLNVKEYIDSFRTKDFVPEYDGGRLLQEALPINYAISQGKMSKAYKLVNETYKSIKKELRTEPVFRKRTGGQSGISTKKPSLDYYEL